MVGGGRVHDRAILDALENFDPELLEKTVWRVTRAGRDPLRGAVANGRWNAIGELEVLYTSIERQGAMAEVGYRLSLEPVWPSKIDYQIHTLAIRAERVLRFDNLDQLASLGVNVARYESFEYGVTQAIAAAVHFLQFDGMVVPSARFPTSNVVLFLDRVQPPELNQSEIVDWAKWRAANKR